MATIAEELNALMAQLPPREQERALSFARELAHPPVLPRTPHAAAAWNTGACRGEAARLT